MAGQIVPLFKREPEAEYDRTYTLPRGELLSNYSVTIDSSENQSLRLAAKEDFMGMCAPILWGSESKEELGELLRGLVVSYLPANRWHLELLVNVADAAWQLSRLRRLRQAVYQGQPAGVGSRGDGSSLKMEKAMNYEPLAAKLNQQMATAINTYRNGTRTINR